MKSFDYFQEILDKSPKLSEFTIIALVHKDEKTSEHFHT